MNNQIRVASWNIAGGRKMKSLGQFDYESEDLDYFAHVLQEQTADIVFLQENHTNDERSIAAEIAKRAGYEYVYDYPTSPSHVDNSYQLGLAIISKQPLVHKTTFLVPYPSFPLFFEDGRSADVHEKSVQVYEYRGLTLANLQLLPLPLFGVNYDDKGKGAELARQIERTLKNNLGAPLIIGGDFNFDTPSKIFPDLFTTYSLHEALPDELTRPNEQGIKKTPDHLLYSDDLVCADSAIVPVQADHYLCVATFNY